MNLDSPLALLETPEEVLRSNLLTKEQHFEYDWYTISGTTARLKSAISYAGSGDCAQTWIATGLVYCADSGDNGGEVFKYPAGGSPVGVFTGSFDTPLGTTAATK